MCLERPLYIYVFAPRWRPVKTKIVVPNIRAPKEQNCDFLENGSASGWASRVHLDVVEKRQISCPYRGSNPNPSVVQPPSPVAYMD
jgi:hypothetical protein